MHSRETIRETFVKLIKKAKTSAGENVFNMRDFNFFLEKMPAINVSTQSESIDETYQHDYGMRRRVLTVDVECYATGDDGARFVDELASTVEDIFHVHPNLKNTVETCRLQNIAMAFGDNGSVALHGSILTFEVTYVTHIPHPEEAAETLKTLFVGLDPETGRGNEDKYQKIGNIHA
ncbi:hypothetical protein [Bartonella ancashensis]|uniref:Putative prophage protein n=1 Tax=Bartonella ancashensis TaxID=1318743 RepID=A0A0M4M4N7_9HYPH|nr:hypothetical protein [Bartonella ancashensis]ALE02867.1 putative prophage protein [Bartonella ancashensis]